MPIYSVWLINKAGGLIYQRTITEGFHPKLTSNDYLVIASTFQSVHAISSRVGPTGPSGGVQSIEWGGPEPYTLHCLHTLTGLKIIITTTGGAGGQWESLLRRTYELYAEYALKNPFYVPEMPVRCELFDHHLQRALSGQ